MKLRSDIRVTLLRCNASDRAIAEAAWVQEPGAGERSDDAVGKVIGAMMKGRHGTPFEHGSFTFHVEAPIFVFREWHRHRVGWSYNEVSARYRVLEPEFYVPPVHRPCVEPLGFKPMKPELVAGDDAHYEAMCNAMGRSFQHALTSYEGMIDLGIAREVARNVLPVATYSAMHATCNPRSLMHFLGLRTKDDRAAVKSYPLWEIEQAARQMETIFAGFCPLTHAAWDANGRVAP